MYKKLDNGCLYHIGRNGCSVLFPAVVDKKPVGGYYVDPNTGDIYSTKQTTMPFRIQGNINSSGYPSVTFTCDKAFGSMKKRTLPIHRIVAETLIPFKPCPSDIPREDWNNTPQSVKDKFNIQCVVNHIDHNKENYHPSNLEWTTTRGNSLAYQKHSNKQKSA